MARERDDDYEDDTDDRPARRRGGDLVEKPGGLDGFFGNLPIAIVVGILTGFCCTGCTPIIIGGVGMALTKTPEGKKGAMFVLIIGVAFLILGGILSATGVVDVNQFNKK